MNRFKRIHPGIVLVATLATLAAGCGGGDTGGDPGNRQ